MPEITATEVKQLRERTGLPLMDCKRALVEANGDQEQAIELLRKRGQSVMKKRSDRVTSFGRFGIFAGTNQSHGAIVELLCESAPVTANEEFVQLANDLAQQLATGPGADTPDQLLDQPSPNKSGRTLGQQQDDLFNRIREVFNIGRLKRIDGGTGGYSHNAGTIAGVLIGVEGGNDECARNVSMHIAAMRPTALSKEDLNPADVEKEREILRAAAIEEGKPPKIVEKMVEGRLRSYFAERILLEQPFVKDDKMTVRKYAETQNMKINEYVHWELGADA